MEVKAQLQTRRFGSAEALLMAWTSHNTIKERQKPQKQNMTTLRHMHCIGCLENNHLHE